MLPANMKLEPGVMAVVIGFSEKPVNLGKIVTLVSFHKKGEVVDFKSTKSMVAQDCWLVEGAGISRKTKGQTTGRVENIIGSQGVFRSQHLMPIRPEEDPLEVTEHENNLQKA